MRITRAFCAFTLVLLCSPSPIIAQDRNSLREQLVAAIKKSEKKWKLDKDTVLDGSTTVGFDVVYLGWAFGTSRADALIYINPTSEDAVKLYPTAFRGCPDCLVKKKILEIKIPDLGDENYVWEDRDMHRAGIVFRKGRILVGIEASSIETATKLAFYVVNEISPRQ